MVKDKTYLTKCFYDSNRSNLNDMVKGDIIDINLYYIDKNDYLIDLDLMVKYIRRNYKLEVKIKIDTNLVHFMIEHK